MVPNCGSPAASPRTYPMWSRAGQRVFWTTSRPTAKRRSITSPIHSSIFCGDKKYRIGRLSEKRGSMSVAGVGSVRVALHQPRPRSPLIPLLLGPAGSNLCRGPFPLLGRNNRNSIRPNSWATLRPDSAGFHLRVPDQIRANVCFSSSALFEQWEAAIAKPAMTRCCPITSNCRRPNYDTEGTNAGGPIPQKSSFAGQ